VIRHTPLLENRLPTVYNEQGYKFNETVWTTKSVADKNKRVLEVETSLCYSTFRIAWGDRGCVRFHATEPQMNFPKVPNSNGREMYCNATAIEHQLWVGSHGDKECGIFDFTNNTLHNASFNPLNPIQRQWNNLNQTARVQSEDFTVFTQQFFSRRYAKQYQRH